MYPSPPALADEVRDEAAHDFWVIKHGIKASGMPAWGKSMQDQYVWGIVAFVQQLPKLDAAQYAALVASSGGHSHGGGESGEHHDDEGMGGHHHDTTKAPHQHEGDDAAHRDDGMPGMGNRDALPSHHE